MSLEIRGLHKAYKSVVALDSLSFDLEPGSAVALLGPNGAGKSTAIRIMVSLLKPDRGNFLWKGEDLLAEPKRLRDLIGYVSQELALDKVLTGAEFMRFCAGLLHLSWKRHRERAYGLLETMGLQDDRDRLIGEYSGGMKRRLDLAAALLNDPAVLVLDEPTTGLDLEAREVIWRLIRQYLDRGGALILASHDFREVAELAGNVLILEKGKVIREGTPPSLKRELGRFILRIKTHEFMAETDKKQVREVFASWADTVGFPDEDEFVTLAYRGPKPMSEIQADAYRDLQNAELAVHSLNVQTPDLEDVYRLALGISK